MHEVWGYSWFWVRLAMFADNGNLPAAPSFVALDPRVLEQIKDAILPELATTSDGTAPSDSGNLPAAASSVALDPWVLEQILDAILPELATTSDGTASSDLEHARLMSDLD